MPESMLRAILSERTKSLKYFIGNIDVEEAYNYESYIKSYQGRYYIRDAIKYVFDYLDKLQKSSVLSRSAVVSYMDNKHYF